MISDLLFMISDLDEQFRLRFLNFEPRRFMISDL